MAATKDGGFLIADSGNNVIRRVSSQGIITRVAGLGSAGDSGDGGPATGAQISFPTCVASTADGGFVLGPRPIRRVSPRGMISTVAGPNPCQEAVLPDGSKLYIPSDRPQQVDRIWVNGREEIAAGDGTCGSAGDGGPATHAELAYPHGVAVLPGGGFLIADTDNGAIRRVSPSGIITTVAGHLSPFPSCGASPSYGEPHYFVLQEPLRGRANRPLTIHFETSFAVAVRVSISRGSQIVFRVQTHAPAGEASSRLGVSLRAGRYYLQLRANGVDPNPDQGMPTPYTETRGAPLVLTP
jgi:hypothetical protein